MKKTEVTKLFSVMMLAWPNAKMFEGGAERLGPAIQLWTECTRDIDFESAQQALAGLCKRSKFPPTIAEFLEETAAIDDREKTEIKEALWSLRTADTLDGVEEYYSSLPQDSRVKAAIDAMGGPQALIISGTRWDVAGFTQAYRQAGRKAARALPGLGRA